VFSTSYRKCSNENAPFEAQSDEVHDIDVYTDKETRGALVPEGSSDEAHGASDVHGVAEDVERESTRPN
jgi:hypothetical protein